MIKKLIYVIIICQIFFSCDRINNRSITIATAANVQFAMDTIATLFEKKTGIKANIIVGSSGKLTAQILQGAPYDVFVSADMKYPMEIYNNNMAPSSPEIYAYGALVIWTLKDSLFLNLNYLNEERIRYIAVANPKTAPYGIAAYEVLKNAGIFEQVKGKLVYGESVSQTNQFIASRTADIGFTSKSVVVSPKMKHIGKWLEIDPANYTPIKQGVIIIKRKNGPIKHTEKFYTFLFSDEVKNILNTFGYKTEGSE